MYYVLTGIVSVYKWHWQTHQIKEISICDTYEMDQFSYGGRLSFFVISSFILHGSSRNLKCMLRNDCCCHLKHHLFNNWTARLYVSDTRYAMCWRLTAQTLLTKECRIEIMHLTIVLMSYNEVWLCKNWNPIFKFFYTDVTKLIKI